jgi:hypothetical protein
VNRIAILAVTAIVLAACAKGGNSSADSAARVVTLPDDSGGKEGGGGGGGPRCPMHGLWQQCSVEERLIRAGMVLIRGDEPVKHDFMHVPGLVYRTGVSEVQIFLYPSQAERERDTAPLDTTTVAPPGKRIVWKSPPTLVTSMNLAAIVLSLNGRQAVRFADAFGGGLRPDAPSK